MMAIAAPITLAEDAALPLLRRGRAGPGRSRRGRTRSWRGSSCGWAGCSATWSPGPWCSSGGRAREPRGRPRLRLRPAEATGAWRLRAASSAKGVVAGLIGAAAVAFLILVFDVAGGAPLQSPAILGSAIFKGMRDPNLVTVSAGPVIGYTILHGAGVRRAWGWSRRSWWPRAEREPAMVLALLIFFAAFEVFFLALIAFWALPGAGRRWPGGRSSPATWWPRSRCSYYFHRRHPGLARRLIGRWVDVVREGIVAGFLGGAVVAVWFLLYDAIRLRPLHTPALLGAAVLQGLRDPSGLVPRLDVVVGYTVFHFAVFAFFGIAVAACLLAAEREPRVLLGLFILFLCFQVFFFGFLEALDAHLAGRAPLVERGDRQPPRLGGDDHVLLPRTPGAGRASPGALDGRTDRGSHRPWPILVSWGACGPTSGSARQPRRRRSPRSSSACRPWPSTPRPIASTTTPSGSVSSSSRIPGAGSSSWTPSPCSTSSPSDASSPTRPR